MRWAWMLLRGLLALVILPVAAVALALAYWSGVFEEADYAE